MALFEPFMGTIIHPSLLQHIDGSKINAMLVQYSECYYVRCYIDDVIELYSEPKM